MPAAAAVGVDDDLAAGQAAVAVRAAFQEAAGRVDVAAMIVAVVRCAAWPGLIRLSLPLPSIRSGRSSRMVGRISLSIRILPGLVAEVRLAVAS